MPVLDEDILRELMHRSTDDLNAPASVSSGIVSRHRRRRLRNRVLSVAATGAVAGTALAVATTGPSAGPGARVATSATPGLRLTATQTVLYKLSAAAASTPRLTGRYVSLVEEQDGDARTSVIDSLTGDIWTYQRVPGAPGELPVDRGGSPTEAAFNAMPTDPAALRAALLSQAEQQLAQAQAEQQQAMAMAGKPGASPKPVLKLTDDDLVFEQATDMLWNPLVGPTLRSALYKVLADTPGVLVNAHATDASGRPAVEISRYDSVAGVEDQTFENPASGAVLETAFFYGAGKPEGTDLYTSVTSSNTLPGDPY
jgi:hypothetical protein